MIPDVEYSSYSKIFIGKMNKECQYCHAFKLKNKSAGMCCASGKVILSTLNLATEPLKRFISVDVITEQNCF